MYVPLINSRLMAETMGISSSPLSEPTIERRPAQFQTGVSLQYRTLPIQRLMITTLANHRVDHDPITGQAFLDDPWRQRCRDNSDSLT
jgi:hypothetical protein